MKSGEIIINKNIMHKKKFLRELDLARWIIKYIKIIAIAGYIASNLTHQQSPVKMNAK
tara:strand:- start:130 stop:303 length:174 start_codon:yes stop_codon:yes gene_type:complete